MPKNKKIPKNYKCESCDYQTTHKTKYIRHCDTLKHKIAMNGITCCGFTYYQKHKRYILKFDRS